MSEQPLMLHRFKIMKSNKTESRSIVETEINMNLVYFEVTGEEALRAQTPSDPGAHFLHVTFPFGIRWHWV